MRCFSRRCIFSFMVIFSDKNPNFFSGKPHPINERKKEMDDSIKQANGGDITKAADDPVSASSPKSAAADALEETPSAEERERGSLEEFLQNGEGMESARKDASVLPFTYDEVKEKLGLFGSWQARIWIVAALISFCNGFVIMVYSFTAYGANHRCAVPACDTQQNYFGDNASSWQFADYVKLSVPGNFPRNNSCHYYRLLDPKQKRPMYYDPETCQEYKKLMRDENVRKSLHQCDHNDLIFDTTIVKTTLLHEYDYVCQNANQAHYVNAAYMVGLLFGHFAFGRLSDLQGRKTSIMVAITVACGFGCMFLAFDGPEVYAFERVMTGFGVSGMFMVSLVLAAEASSQRIKTMLGMSLNIAFALGEMALCLEAYFIRDWRTLQLAAHAPIILLLLPLFLVSESPRWLLSVGEASKAIDLLKEAFKANGINVPEDLGARGVSVFRRKKQRGLEKATTVCDVLKPIPLAFRFFCVALQWFAVALGYYGLQSTVTSYSGDIYLNSAVSAFFEIPGYVFAICVMDSWGRRSIMRFTQLSAGIALLVEGWFFQNSPDALVIQLVLHNFSKCMVSASFGITYLYTAEMYTRR